MAEDKGSRLGFDDNSPWWMKTLWVAGPITLIALGLTYVIASTVQSDVRAIRENLMLHHGDTETLHRNIERYMSIQNNLTRQLCVNAAATPDERAGCFKE